MFCAEHTSFYGLCCISSLLKIKGCKSGFSQAMTGKKHFRFLKEPFSAHFLEITCFFFLEVLFPL